LKIFSSGVLKDGRPYLAMEYVEGRSLADLLAKEKSLDSQTAIEIAIQIARGMAEVHDRGILHRDLKPSNIMLCDDGRSPLAVKVIDFGLVRLQRDSNLTATGIAVGSPAYMSPEQSIHWLALFTKCSLACLLS
jgi:serine/threonine-protein kinase